MHLSMVQQQRMELQPKPYGGLVEEVPSHLNVSGSAILLDREAYDARLLLYRDLALGQPLVTREMAAAILDGLELIVLASNARFRKMIEGLPQIPLPGQRQDMLYD